MCRERPCSQELCFSSSSSRAHGLRLPTRKHQSSVFVLHLLLPALFPLLPNVLRRAASLRAKPLAGRAGPPRGVAPASLPSPIPPHHPARPCRTSSWVKSHSFLRSQDGRPRGACPNLPLLPAGRAFITCSAGISKRFFCQGQRVTLGGFVGCTVTIVIIRLLSRESSVDSMQTGGRVCVPMRLAQNRQRTMVCRPLLYKITSLSSHCPPLIPRFY